MFISPEVLQDIHLFETTIWRMLARGAADAKHAYRLCSIATVNEECKPDTRTVVLRACDIPNKSLSFHTDIRSQKVSHFHHQPEVCMLFWDYKESLQLRVYGAATIHHLDELADSKLSVLPPSQLQLYALSVTPGSTMEKSLPENFQEALIKKNFAWIQVGIHRVDALHLARTGIHTRVCFHYHDGQLTTANYLKA